MTPEIIKAIVNGGAAVAVIVVVVYFLRFLTQERASNRQERESNRQERERTMEVIGNHLEHSSEAARQAGESMKEGAKITATALRSVTRHCKKMGGTR